MAQWSGSFESNPTGGSSPSLGDDSIRELKGATRERIEKEHVMTTGTGNLVDHGWHRKGTARVYFTQGTPVNLPDSATSLASRPGDARGRVWIHSTTFLQKVYNGSAWVRTQREMTRVSIQGMMATGTDVVPRIMFVRTVTLLRLVMRTRVAPVGGSLIVNLLKNGSTSIFNGGTKLTIPAGSYYTILDGARLAAASISPLSYLRFDVDAVGVATKAADVTVGIEAMV